MPEHIPRSRKKVSEYVSSKIIFLIYLHIASLPEWNAECNAVYREFMDGATTKAERDVRMKPILDALAKMRVNIEEQLPPSVRMRNVLSQMTLAVSDNC